jgi:cbb3-type cytochrome oxidase subunit 3
VTLDELNYIWGTKDTSMRYKKHAAMLGAGLIFSLIGPYDTSNMPEHLMRVGYWTSLLLLGSLVSGPSMRWLKPRMKIETNIWLALLCLSIVISLPVYVVVIAYDMFLSPEGAFTLDHILNFLTGIDYGLLGYVFWFAQVIIITLLAVGAISFAYSATAKRQAQQAAKPGQHFLNRLPADIGSDLICLNMEDHYVRAYTTKGDALILMRFSDAVTELEGYSGQQTHRSWWVAYGAISQTSKDKRRHIAHLSNEMDVPVSQTYADKMKAAGFI